ncbi:PIN domain-containing protein [Bradyrhizobium sp. LB5.2]|uniref:PIN domain-containing protein n=1 Tax=Bradyrhizobium sp. LB5.2 TaxID=3156329 RepID=UPI00339833FA
MLNLLVDTCVWLDMAKDYRHQPTLAALEQMIEGGEVSLILPQQAVAEFARNKERIIRDSAKSLSSHFKRVKEAVRQFGTQDDRDQVLSSLDNVDHRIVILGEAVQESVSKIEKLFSTAVVIDANERVKLRAAQRAIDKQAPFHRDKNSIGDAILIEVYRDVLSGGNPEHQYAFVTHNKHDFSNMGGDERHPHPDLAELFDAENSTYALAVGEVLHQHAPEWMEEVKWEFEYREEPRLLSEIMEAENLLFRQVWYNRHWNLRIAIERGKHKVVTAEEWEKYPKRRNKVTVDAVWQGALAAAKRTEEEVGLENLGPWTDFEWGMVNGKLSALRWVMGSEWDFLDT